MATISDYFDPKLTQQFAAAGIVTLAQLEELEATDALTTIRGVGAARASEISATLDEMRKNQAAAAKPAPAPEPAPTPAAEPEPARAKRQGPEPVWIGKPVAPSNERLTAAEVLTWPIPRLLTAIRRSRIVLMRQEETPDILRAHRISLAIFLLELSHRYPDALEEFLERNWLDDVDHASLCAEARAALSS